MNKKEVIERIETEIKNCKKCDLCKTRIKPITDGGNLDAEVMFIGEAPGYNEDLTGKAFIGKAGEILNKLLKSIDLPREDTYITSIVKCKPPYNNDPTDEHITACKPYIDRQISIIRPKVIVPLGRFACAFIFEKYGLKKERISEVHGKTYTVNSLFGCIKIIPQYHPSVACYNVNMMDTLLEDFKAVRHNI
ncbi:uracil-DNA glycosylase [archaeon]|nr:uracil-DNA glycosylase [archaeon]